MRKSLPSGYSKRRHSAYFEKALRPQAAVCTAMRATSGRNAPYLTSSKSKPPSAGTPKRRGFRNFPRVEATAQVPVDIHAHAARAR